jgi:YggT family protein
VVVRILVDIVQLYIFILFVRIIASWFPINPWSRAARVVRVIAAVTDPVLVPVRRLLPPVRMGGTSLDLSPLIIFIVLEILLTVLRSD